MYLIDRKTLWRAPATPVAIGATGTYVQLVPGAKVNGQESPVGSTVRSGLTATADVLVTDWFRVAVPPGTDGCSLTMTGVVSAAADITTITASRPRIMAVGMPTLGGAPYEKANVERATVELAGGFANIKAASYQTIGSITPISSSAIRFADFRNNMGSDRAFEGMTREGLAPASGHGFGWTLYLTTQPAGDDGSVFYAQSNSQLLFPPEFGNIGALVLAIRISNAGTLGAAPTITYSSCELALWFWGQGDRGYRLR